MIIIMWLLCCVHSITEPEKQEMSQSANYELTNGGENLIRESILACNVEVGLFVE